MKYAIARQSRRLGLKVYPKGEQFRLWYHNQEWERHQQPGWSVRDIAKICRSWGQEKRKSKREFKQSFIRSRRMGLEMLTNE